MNSRQLKPVRSPPSPTASNANLTRAGPGKIDGRRMWRFTNPNGPGLKPLQVDSGIIAVLHYGIIPFGVTLPSFFGEALSIEGSIQTSLVADSRGLYRFFFNSAAGVYICHQFLEAGGV